MFRLSNQHEEFATEDGLITPKNKNLYWAFGLVAGAWAIALLISSVIWITGKVTTLNSPESSLVEPLVQFESDTDFRSYVAVSSKSGGMFGQNDLLFTDQVTREIMPAELAAPSKSSERVSSTNVQVMGIDEPDIVKTNGEELFISSQGGYWIEPMPMPRVMMDSPVETSLVPPDFPQQNTEIVQAVPVSEIKTLASVDRQGELLLLEDVLMVLGSNAVYGFDVEDATKPEELWQLELDESQMISTARLVDDSLVVVSQLSVYSTMPCPIPLMKGQESMTIACTDIWRPNYSMNVDTTYTVMRIDPKTGLVLNTVSFVGTAGQTITYVSPESVYVTFVQTVDWSELTADFLLDEQTTLVPTDIKEKLRKTLELSISQAAKQVEIEQILMEYGRTLGDDERMKWEAERYDQMAVYAGERKRELETTTIAKIDMEKLAITAMGKVPGHPLNQFSMDEYKSHLRIATTVGGRIIGAGTQSANDVYVLNSEMKTVGKLLDLGLEERIYAVRFMGERGFLVTFKETDPLYALDLSRPDSPVVTGELKIPGYSSYLHPLEENLLVGIGMEDGGVKISLFDVSDMKQPKEVDVYRLRDYWSEVLSNHHAFMQDADNKAFFVPTGQGGYVLSYEGSELSLLSTVSESSIQRALYIGDNWYMVGTNRIVVLDTNSWNITKTFSW